MRYLGNKTRLLEEIESFIYENIKNIDKCKTFCDLFSGTGSVGAHFKNKFRIIANDKMRYAYFLSEAYINGIKEYEFDKLGFEPFEHLNNKDINQGFFYNNYSPASPEKRMYFSVENAGKIDFMRTEIEKWYKKDRINEGEYYYLIMCLLEAVSLRANIAGVYGAYLKKWDSRALKKMVIKPIKIANNPKESNRVYNEDSSSLIYKISGDILYIDPPYSKNSYSTQYHILETLVKYDKPIIKGVTGTRQDKVKSKFSVKYKAHKELERIIAEANFRYIFLSYNNKGLMEYSFIEKLLKRNSKKFNVKEVAYQNYTNKKSSSDDENKEYLFFIEKKQCRNVESPLNYMGSKFKVVDEIKRVSKQMEFQEVIDVFSGGLNVGINLGVQRIHYNDINHFVKEIVEVFSAADIESKVNYICKTIDKYCLKKADKEAYIRFRDYYNSKKLEERNPLDLYVLLQFGFQQQLRFNSKHEFNNPVGMSGFNEQTMIKIFEFNRVARKKAISFQSEDFNELGMRVGKESLYYLDPPYFITLGSYNDGKRGFKKWDENCEKELYKFVDKIDKNGNAFILSNVIAHRGKTNLILMHWLEERDYKVLLYHHRKRSEILVTNIKGA